MSGQFLVVLQKAVNGRQKGDLEYLTAEDTLS